MNVTATSPVDEYSQTTKEQAVELRAQLIRDIAEATGLEEDIMEVVANSITVRNDAFDTFDLHTEFRGAVCPLEKVFSMKRQSVTVNLCQMNKAHLLQNIIENFLTNKEVVAKSVSAILG